MAVKALIRPDNYIAGVLAAAAFKFIDIRNLEQPAFLSLLAALTAYVSLIVLSRWINPVSYTHLTLPTNREV